MTELTVMSRSAVDEGIQALRGVSSEIDKNCQFLASSMRGTYIKLVNAIHEGNDTEALSIFEKIRESELVVGLSAKLHSLREGALKLVEALAPWFKTIGGLVVALIGYFIFAEISLVIAGILVVGGFLYAVQNGLDAATKTSLRD